MITLTVKKSKVEGAGNGVFTETNIPKDTVLGEYMGKRISEKMFYRLGSTAYTFKVEKNNGRVEYIDGNVGGNWTSFVNGAKTPEQHRKVNISSYQENRKIYFSAMKHIARGEELILDYGGAYWQE